MTQNEDFTVELPIEFVVLVSWIGMGLTTPNLTPSQHRNINLKNFVSVLDKNV